VNVFMSSLGNSSNEKSSKLPELHTTVEKLVDVARLTQVAAYVFNVSIDDGVKPLLTIC
jgi:hypothetical protein